MVMLCRSASNIQPFLHRPTQAQQVHFWVRVKLLDYNLFVILSRDLEPNITLEL